MEQQTAVEWLKVMLEWNYGYPQMLEIKWENLDDLFERAKQMESDRRKEDFKIGYNQGYLDAKLNHINDADNLANEQEYLNE